MTKTTTTPPTAELADSDDRSGADLATDPIGLENVIKVTLDRLFPIDPGLCGGIPPRCTRYDLVIHAQIVRFAFLGLANATIAKAVGISPSTLAGWLKDTPKLASDVWQARSLAVSDAALRLRQLMSGNGATALNAVRFFLERRAEEFGDRKHIEVTVTDDRALATSIREEMYGLPAIEAENDDDTIPVPGLPALRL